MSRIFVHHIRNRLRPGTKSMNSRQRHGGKKLSVGTLEILRVRGVIQIKLMEEES